MTYHHKHYVSVDANHADCLPWLAEIYGPHLTEIELNIRYRCHPGSPRTYEDPEEPPYCEWEVESIRGHYDGCREDKWPVLTLSDDEWEKLYDTLDGDDIEMCLWDDHEIHYDDSGFDEMAADDARHGID